MAQATPAPATALRAGTVCWHELHTPDAKKAIDFFSKLVGWTADANDMGGFTYHSLKKNGESFGGVMETKGKEWEGVPPHWMLYFACDDVDASAERVKTLGGSVCVPPTDIPSVGRFSVVSDPTGGTFALFRSSEPYTPAPAMVWNELMTTDQNKAVEFYRAMFGYEISEMNMGEAGVYKMLVLGETTIGGVFQMDAEQQKFMPTFWLPYIGVDDVDATAERVPELGGTVIIPPTDIPNNIGRFCMTTDPTGATVSYYQGGQG